MPSLTIQGQAEVLVTIETSRWGMELDYDDLTYRLFKLIDSQLGRIRFIARAARRPLPSGRGRHGRCPSYWVLYPL